MDEPQNGIGSILIGPTAATDVFRQSLAENQNDVYTELMKVADRHNALFREGRQAGELNTFSK